MVIDLKAIERTPRHFDLVFEKEWWRFKDENHQIRGLNGPVTCSMDIYRAGIRFVLEGDLSGAMSVYCDRCLDAYSYPLDHQFRLFLKTGRPDQDQSEQELLEEDLHTYLINENEVDLEDIVREQIYLSLPIKALCREDCPGLCPKCGINLKKASCKCIQKHGHPGFAKLKALKIDK